ncbi:hypothetical protein R84B8_00624 [Treponema sp. R8-4-B8]
MNNLYEYTKNRLVSNNDEIKNDKDLFRCELREIMQEIILPGLSETDFFENNVFQGGTAIRMLYGLKRYSEDLDFTMKNNNIDDFSWVPYGEKIREYSKKYGVDFLYEMDHDRFGNKIIRLRSDSLIGIFHKKDIVPVEFTYKGNRKKIEIKLETNYSVNTFIDEIKEADNFNKCNVRVFDLPSLFAGKLNAVLTREKTNTESKIIERIDQGRDWYDFIWYVNKGIKPNYNFLSDKLDYKGDFKGLHIKADREWTKNALFKRMEGLNLDELNNDIKTITLNKYRILLNKELLTNIITQLK